MRFLRRIHPNRLVPVFLLLLTILAFGLLIPWLGYYWDDWAKLLVSRLYGLGGYLAYYAEDRPLSAWTHIVFTPLAGQSPLGWQILNLVLRWLSAWAMWWALGCLWPRARARNLVAVALFVVYPVFLQQAAGVTFHQQWLQYALFFVSLGAMIRAAKQPNRRAFRYWGWTVLAAAAMLLQLSVTEYFVPLELVRPFVLWFALDPGGVDQTGTARRAPRAKAAGVLLDWAPYLLLLAAYVVWRLFFYSLPGEDPYRANTLYDLLADPVGTLKKYTGIVLVDELWILVVSWAKTQQIDYPNLSQFGILSYLVGIGAGALAAAFLWVYERSQPVRAGAEPASEAADGQGRWMRQALILGLAAVLLGPVPAWITGRQVVFDYHSDRYALAAQFGAALLFAAGVTWLAQRRAQRAVLAGLLVALAVSYHLRVGNEYRWIWTDELRTFWQLSWRAPGLKPGTALLFENEPFPNQGLFSTSAALNLVYPQERKPDPTSLDLDYWVYTIRPRYTHAPDSMNITFSTQFRTLKFSGSTPGSLVVFKDASKSSCIWVLSEADALNPAVPDLVKAFLPISNLEQILPEPVEEGYPPEELLGPEPAHGWCYYFQKASLAAQLADWQEVSRLAGTALEAGYRPSVTESNSAYEWRPFVVGLARSGDWDEAARLTLQAYEVDRESAEFWCGVWESELGEIEKVRSDLGCPTDD